MSWEFRAVKNYSDAYIQIAANPSAHDLILRTFLTQYNPLDSSGRYITAPTATHNSEIIFGGAGTGTIYPILANCGSTSRTASNTFQTANTSKYVGLYLSPDKQAYLITYQTLSEWIAAHPDSGEGYNLRTVYPSATPLTPFFTGNATALAENYPDLICITAITSYSNNNDGSYSASAQRSPTIYNGYPIIPYLHFTATNVWGEINYIYQYLTGDVDFLVGLDTILRNTSLSLVANSDMTASQVVSGGVGTGYGYTFVNKNFLISLFNVLKIPFTFDADTIKNTNTPDFDDGYSPLGQSEAGPDNGVGTGDNTSDDITTEEPGETGYSAFNTLYAMSRSMLNNLASYLWTSTFLDDVKLLFNNPMEGIVSCRMFPFSISGHDGAHVGGSTAIQVGNVTTTAYGHPISSGYGAKFDMGSIDVEEYFGSFMDYEPYTEISIYLPYIGIKELPVNEVMKTTLSVTYVVDFLTGACNAMIYADSKMIATYQGMCGIDIPITSTNAAQFAAGIAIATGSGLIGVATMAAGEGAAALAGAGLLLSTAKNIASNKRSINKGGIADGQNGLYLPNYCYLIVSRPVQQLPTNYASEFGRPCNIAYKLSTLSGYTECYDPKVNNITGATSAELAEIKSLLESGVIIK